MNNEWSLDILYKAYDDENYINDMKKLISLNKDIESFSNNLINENEAEGLLKAIEYMEDYSLLARKLSFFVELKQSTNTSDVATVNESNKLEKIISESSKSYAILTKYLAQIENKENHAKKNSKINDYLYLLKEMEKESKHLLSDDVEDIISKLNISSASAWSSMQSFLTSTLDVEFEGKTITLSEIRNLAHNHDKQVRKKAYEAELKSYEKINDAISFSLNNIKTQVNTICELRGFDSPLHQTLEKSKMKKETLDAMLLAMEEYMPVFHKYLKHKAKLLAHKNGLPWYDLFAPLGESEKKFTEIEARDYLLKHFRNFSDDLADMVEEAFENNWIDFNPRRGKVGGAFCLNIPFAKQSRILSNFTGSLSDVVTLAHELGHAYHGMIIQDHLPLNTNYSMPVAETASTFNEAIIMNAAIADADLAEKIALIESQLQDVTQIICDIYSRYLFETQVFNKSRKGFLFSDELKEIMLNAQKVAYGDGLDHKYLHPYMWVNKGHYYSESLSFYNFPYAFGGLLARGLYEKYKNEGDDFLPKYRKFLYSTTIMSVEDACQQAEINLEDPVFWKTSLKSYEKLIDEFIELSSK